MEQNLITIIVALFGALIGAVATGSFGIYRDFKADERKKRNDQIQSHSNLLGCKFRFMQYLHSYFLADIAARSSQLYAKTAAMATIDFMPGKEYIDQENFNEAHKYINNEFIKRYEKSPDTEESQRYKERAEMLQLQIGDIKERLWILIGYIKILFDDVYMQNYIDEIAGAEKGLKSFENDTANAFRKLDDKFIDDLNNIYRDRLESHRYADNPNKNRDESTDAMEEELRNICKTAEKGTVERIKILDSRITNLLDYLESILNDQQLYNNCNLFCSSNVCPLKPQSLENEKN